jgi:hypothetical protein
MFRLFSMFDADNFVCTALLLSFISFHSDMVSPVLLCIEAYEESRIDQFSNNSRYQCRSDACCVVLFVFSLIVGDINWLRTYT